MSVEGAAARCADTPGASLSCGLGGSLFANALDVASERKDLGRTAAEKKAEQAFALWVAREIMPHESGVRAWLRSRVRSSDDVDDIIQEAYAKLAGLTAYRQIARPDAYFFQTARNLWIDHIRRARLVRFEAIADVDTLAAVYDAPSPEQIVSDREELSLVLRLVETLPARCRDIFRLRKIEGLTQREIASRIGVSESIVENDGVKGLALLIRALRDAPVSGDHGSGSPK